MQRDRHEWKRFWCPRGDPISLSDGGYLADPDTLWGQYANPTAVAFEALTDVPCLVLLGEPGSGKSTALAIERDRSERGRPTSGDATLWFDLRAYESDMRLEKAIFEHPTVRDWLAGSHRLHVYLDSLDECLLRVDTAVDLLLERLAHLPRRRLNLRIACRAADWPGGFEGGLGQLWGADNVRAYALAPLRQADVAQAVTSLGIDGQTFLRAVSDAGVIPLAATPVTLDFLLNTYAQSGSLPPTQREAYERGCELLCEETSEHRRETRLIGNYTAHERMVAAERIAAVTIFSNRYAVWTGLDRGDAPAADITVREVLGAARAGYRVGEHLVREALATGLFSARSSHDLGWAHHSYAEFLAARFVATNLSPQQAMGLLVHASDPSGKLVPQLREVAGWIGAMMPEVFTALVQVDPEVLLRSNVVALGPAARAQLVAALLALYDTEGRLDRDPALRRHYATLAHPALADQLRPYITDDRKGMIVRRVAIEIAEACSLSDLEVELKQVALDLSQPVPIRRLAVDALAEVGDDAARIALRPLAFGQAGGDPDDDLRGAALRALWPQYLTPVELFDALIPPQNDHYYGAYAGFLHSSFDAYLRPADLSVALEWAERQARRPPRDVLGFVVDRLLLKAWAHLDTVAIVEGFARVALTRLLIHQGIVATESHGNEGDSGDGESRMPFAMAIRADDVRRRQVLEAMLPLLVATDADPLALAYSRTPVVTPTDVSWLIGRLRGETSEPVAHVLALLITQTADLTNPDQLDVVLRASRDVPPLADQLRWLLTPVRLDSPEAERARALYRRQQGQEVASPQVERPAAVMPQVEIDLQIHDLLARCESGDAVVWWQLNLALTVTAEGLAPAAEFEPDITKSPGWGRADGATRRRLISAARRYVVEQDPLACGWLTPRSLRHWMGRQLGIHRPAYAGYRALILLQRQAPEVVVTLGGDIWRRWAPILVTFPWLPGDEVQESHDALMRVAYGHAADEIIATFLAQVRQQNREMDFLHGLHRVEGCFADRFADAVLRSIKHEQFRPAFVQALLTALIYHGSHDARAFAQALVARRTRGTKAHDRAILAARILFTRAPDVGWPILWPVFRQDPAFGREVVLGLYRLPSGEESIAHRLTEEQVADLFIWLAALFPPNEDPPLPQGIVTDEQHIVMWRNSLVAQLPQRRTSGACEALRRIVTALPDYDWLRWQLQEAEESLRHDTWRPVTPATIFTLAEDADRRLVESGEQLLDVIVESLGRLEQELQGETSAAAFLWNEASTGRQRIYTPKDENALSDYVKIHLERDLRQRGIVANREVVIRQGRGSTGERTDIQVDAILPGSRSGKFDSVTAIIEVKGCWYHAVLEAMETQLVERYLRDNQCRYGLYLVGWYVCAPWFDGDRRKRDTPRLSLEDARQRFAAQADELSRQQRRAIQVRSFILNTALR